jgi:two-component system sensor histidine kinase KdpD
VRTLRDEYEVVPEATLKAAIDRMRTDHRAVVHNLPRRSVNISVPLIGGAELESDPIPKKSVCSAQEQPKFDPIPYFAALLLVGTALALAWWLQPWIGVESVDLVFLMAIIGVAARYGLLPALSASVAAWLCYDFFFLPPIFELNIPGPTDTAAFLTFAIVAIIVSNEKSARRTI